MKHKKPIKNLLLPVVFLLLLLVALAACGEDGDGDVPAGMKLASDPEAVSYRLYVPENWQVSFNTNGADKGWSMAQSAEGDKANVVVTYHSNSAIPSYSDRKKTLTEYFEGNDTYEGMKSKLAASFDKTKNEAGEEVSSFTLDEAASSFFTVKKGEAEIAAYRVTYEGLLSGTQIKQVLVMIFDDDYFYNITFTAAPDLYERISDTVEAIIANFRLKG